MAREEIVTTEGSFQPASLKWGLSERKAMGWQQQVALPVALLLVAVPAVYHFLGLRSLAAMWIFGLAFGIVLQRSRFCFASAFRDLFLFGEGRVLKGIIIGMAVATVGFALIMSKLVADPSTGAIPSHAGAYPVGYQILLGGFLFGLGMVIAGGCASGTLYRIGEGYLASVVTLVGMLLGMYVLATTWGWWWTQVISRAPRVWLPHTLGWAGAILVVMAVLGLGYGTVLWWETRQSVPGGAAVAEAQPLSPSGTPSAAAWERILRRAWPAALGGLLLGMLNTFQYLFQQPWGITTEVSLWSGWVARSVGLPTDGLAYYGAKPAGVELLKHPPWLSAGAMVDFGIVGGALLAALLANEFKVRTPRAPGRYVQSLTGGVLMGYGSRLAQGCNIGGFFSAIPALGLSGWVFAVGLVLGSYAGVRVIRRLV